MRGGGRERIPRRLPVKFLQEVLGTLNSHRVVETEAVELLGVLSSRTS
jgi:hypothetical protein